MKLRTLIEPFCNVSPQAQMELLQLVKQAFLPNQTHQVFAGDIGTAWHQKWRQEQTTSRRYNPALSSFEEVTTGALVDAYSLPGAPSRTVRTPGFDEETAGDCVLERWPALGLNHKDNIDNYLRRHPVIREVDYLQSQLFEKLSDANSTAEYRHRAPVKS